MVKGLAVWFIMLGELSKATGKSPGKPAFPDLDRQSIKHFQIALENGLSGIFREDNSIFTTTYSDAFYIKSIYKPDAKEIDLGFGSWKNPTEDSERVLFPAAYGKRRIRSLFRHPVYRLFLDSDKRQLLAYEVDKDQWIAPIDIVFDLIKPARDRGGEPTRVETATLQKSVQSSYAKLAGDAEFIVGGIPLPASWQKPDGAEYALWLRWAVAPLVTLRCEGKPLAVCTVVRSCFVKGLSREIIERSQGFAYDPIEKHWLVGDPVGFKIHRLDAKSCVSAPKLAEQSFSKDFRWIAGLFVDQDQSLWISLAEPEAYHSSSLLVFPRKAWAKKK